MSNTEPTQSTVATFTSEGCAIRPQHEGETFTVVSGSITYTGDFLQQFVKDFESTLLAEWRLLRQALDAKSYGQARIFKANIKKYWEPVTQVYTLDRFMNGNYGETTFHPPIWSVYTLRESLRKYWIIKMEGRFDYDHRIQLQEYCFSNYAVFTKLEELDDDEWLKDLWEEYGLLALKKVRIPTK